MNKLRITSNLFVYSLCHFLVDAACLMLLLGGIDAKAKFLTYVLVYNILAFGLQLPFGWLTDRLRNPVFVAFLGCFILSTALLLFKVPILAVTLAGIGNALFHVGGGTISLNLKPNKAALPGVFVATGAIGLFAGGVILKIYGFHPNIMVAFLVFIGLIMLFLEAPKINYEIKKVTSPNYLILFLLLLFIAICIRSLVGLSFCFPWKSNMSLLILLTISLALGKGLGGFISDYFGWIKISVGGLIVSAVLLFFGTKYAAVGIIGVFFFNLTMPVTLVAISNSLPGRPGFSFGLTTFALILGAMPTFFSLKSFFTNGFISSFLIILSAIILFIGLKLYYKFYS